MAAAGSVPSAGSGPGVASVSPEAGPAGTEVVVWGENFGPWAGVAQGTSGVSFSGVWGTPTYWSETEIRVPVPPGVESSLVVVTAGGSASNGVEFTVTSGGKAPGGRTEDWVVSARSAEAADEEAGPAITSLDPVEGAVGTAVTITGTNFGATAGEAGRVSFNGTQGVPTSWSETTIQVPVPAGATTGPVRVTAQAGGVSNGVEFSLRSFRSNKLGRVASSSASSTRI